uniref:leucine-rich repeat-containing protein 41-like isoform X2 n=1 Tax=Doryrhamphus excisus TaxID=161450 RepID=UPI0025AE42BA|nr:leucine-rich repeat-containing protein 41-like isoform X2 [Doryrhamphus excisus]
MSLDTENQITTLSDICLRAVSEHLKVLGTTAVLGLPRELLKGLTPYLNVCQLDELQPGLNLKGISTLPEWHKVYLQLGGWASLKASDPEQNVKQEVMWRMFAMVINDQSLPQSVRKHLNTPDILLTAAKSINHFKLSFKRNSRIDLIVGQTPVLRVLEETVTTLSLWLEKIVLGEERRLQMYIIHRLMKHGVTKHVVLRTDYHYILSKVLFEGGCLSKHHREDTWNDEGEEEGSPAKLLKMNPDVLDQNVRTCTGCPNRVIEHLELADCSLRSLKNLTKILPSCSHLTALTVRGKNTFQFSDVLDFTKALKQLFQHSDASLRRLSIYSLSYLSLLSLLLHAYPRLKELNVEFDNVFQEKLPLWKDTGLCFDQCGSFSRRRLLCPNHPAGELPLSRLSVEMHQDLLTAPNFLVSVLRCCPHLVTLHVKGMRLLIPYSQKELLNTLSEYNGNLTSLYLTDLNLSDCFHELLTLLRVCKLEELHLHDCRLLERHSDKQAVMVLLVKALKAVPCLRKLTLSENRLACNVHMLAELFSGPAPSSVEYLDLRLNFIQPADLLLFAEALTTHPPPNRLTLNLAYNMGVRDKRSWNAALDKLRPFCQLVFNDWDSRNLMADHISNM